MRQPTLRYAKAWEVSRAGMLLSFSESALSQLLRLTSHEATHLEVCKGMRGFQSRNNSFQPGNMLEGLQSLRVSYCVILGTPDVTQVTVLRTNSGVVQPAAIGLATDSGPRKGQKRQVECVPTDHHDESPLYRIHSS